MSLKYSNEKAKQYLANLGEVKNFYITKLGGDESHLIYYVRPDNTAWAFMDDNELMVRICVKYLVSINTPVLRTIEELDRYEKDNGIL